MADIRTRDVTRGTIKTIDRAASSTHRIKEAVVRMKPEDISGRQNSDENGYAQDRIEHYAGGSMAAAVSAEVETFHQISHNSASKAGKSVQNDETIHHFAREQGVKAIIGRREKAKLADQEVLRDAEITMHSGRIRMESAERGDILGSRIWGHIRAGIADNRHKAPGNDEIVQRRRRQYAIGRITDRKADRSLLRRIMGGKANASKDRAARSSGRLLRDIAGRSQTILSGASLGGTVAIIVIIVMVFCGSAFTMVGDENGDNFAYDFYEIGPGDTAIVKVAQAQIGNVGGDKYWKWYGFSSHVHWCAVWVSWCSNQCGYLKAGIMPRFAVVGNGASWFRERHRWASGGYSPKPGDVIFFDWNRDGELDHVGLVESCDGKTVTTIEGNSGNACRRQMYRRGAAVISGYGIPGYPTNTGDKTKDNNSNDKKP